MMFSPWLRQGVALLAETEWIAYFPPSGAGG